MSTVEPPAPAGEVAVMDVLELTVKPVAPVPPNFTAVAPVNPVPMMATVVPPAAEPFVGDTPVIVGAAD